MRPGSPLSGELLNCSHPFRLTAGGIVALSELPMDSHGWWLPVPYTGASLLLCNAGNRALSDVQVEYANMEFLYVIFKIK